MLPFGITFGFVSSVIGELWIMDNNESNIRYQEIIKLSRISAGITFGWYFFMRCFCAYYKISGLYIETLVFVLFLLSPILGNMMLKENIKSIRFRAFGVGYKVFFIFFWIMWSVHLAQGEENFNFLAFDLLAPLLPASFLSIVCALFYMEIFIFLNKDKPLFVEQKQENMMPKIQLRQWLGKPPVMILRPKDDISLKRERCARVCFIVNAHLSFIFMLFASYHLGWGLIFLIFLGFPILLGSAFLASAIFALLAKRINIQNSIVKEWVIALIGFSLYQTLLLLAIPVGKCEGCLEAWPFIFNITISAVFLMILYIILMRRNA